MKTFTNPRSVAVLLLFSLLSLGSTLFAPPAAAHIYRWDNGALITEGDAVPGANLSGMALGYADLAGASLSGARFKQSDLTRAHLMDAYLLRANFESATLTAADLSGANLTDANFRVATLTAADFSGAVVTGASFSSTTASGFTAAQLYSTASCQSGDLSGIRLGGNDLSGWNFAGKNLTDASFYRATLTAADLSGAVVTGADFGDTTGFTAAQLYSTASYQNGNLSGIRLGDNDLSG